MKIFFNTILYLGFIVFFQGCSEETKNELGINNLEKFNLIKGKTTLSSGIRKETKAIVCFDINRDNLCNENEPHTFVDSLGNFELNSSFKIEDGDVLLVMGGKSLLPPQNKNNFIFSKFYHHDEVTQNINIMSSFVMKNIEKHTSLSYKESLNNFSEFYHYSKRLILSNPLDNADDSLGKGNDYFKFISALEIKVKENFSKNFDKKENKFFFFPIFNNRDTSPTEVTPPSAEEVNVVIAENEDLFDSFFTALSEYYENFLSFFSTEVILNEGESDLSYDEPAEIVPIMREELNGAWFIEDASGDKVCSYISSNNDVVVTEVGGKKTELTMSISGTINDIKAMKLTYGFISADTINIDTYMTDHTFRGSYASDNEQITGTKIITLDACKERLNL